MCFDKVCHTSRFSWDSPGLKALSRYLSQSTKTLQLRIQSASIALNKYWHVMIGLL